MSRAVAAFVVVLAACETPTDLPPPPTANAPGTISGQLFVSQAGTDNLIPAAGAKASIVGTSVETTADSSGRFVLTPVLQTTGAILLQADPDDAGDYERQQLVDFASIGAGPGHDATVGQVTLNPNATITGKVTLADVTATTGLADTTIFVPEGPFTASTGDDGSFVFDNLPSGQITLAFFRQGYVSQVISGISLDPGQELQLSPVVLQPNPPGEASATGSISGQVVFVPAVSNPSETVASAAGAETVPFTVNADGTYSATLATGLYTLTFSYPNYDLVTEPNVLVSAGLTTSVPLVVMTPSPPGTDAGMPDAGPPADAGTPDAGASDGGSDGGVVDAGPPPVPPVAVITMTQSIIGTNNVVQLNGSESTAPGEAAGASLTFDWTQTFGTSVTFSGNDSAEAATTTFTAPASTGSLGFTLTVTDTRTMLTGQASATMTVILSPTASITPLSLQATPGAMVTFDGAGSLDPATYSLSYQWSSAELDLGTSTTDSAITFIAPSEPGSYALSLVVSDLFSSSVPAATAELTVVVTDGGMLSSQPVARIATSGVVGVGAITQLNGTDSQAADEPPGQNLSYAWMQVSGDTVTLSANDSVLAGAPSFTAPATPQVLEFTLVVTDTTTNLTGQATTVVQVIDPPVAVIAPTVLQVAPGATATFTGAQSYDPSGNPLTYRWSSPVLALGAATGSSLSLTAPTGAGTYSVALQVDNGFVASQTTLATLQVTAGSTAPTVNAGADQSVVVGATVTLSATSSVSNVVSWSWAQTAGTPVTLSGANTAQATFTAPQVSDVLVFQVTAATTGAIVTASTDVQVSLAAPLVSTPPSLSVATGAMVALVATGVSTDSITYSWVQTAGSPTVTLTNASTATASFMAPASYAYLTFEVTATAGANSATASVNVTVNASSPPGIVQSDPASDGDGAGPWLMATATFNEALAASSVTSDTAFITDSTGEIQASNVEYIAATQTIRVVPLVPLVPGQSYAVTIGGVTDEDPTPNVHPTQTLHWTARPITWTTWTDSTVQTKDPAPGVVADDSSTVVVINETAGACASYDAVFLGPVAGGTLADSALCEGSASFVGEPVKRGFRAGGSLYVTGDVPHWGTSGYFEWQDASGAHTFSGTETNGPAGGFFSDGSNIYLMSSTGSAQFYTCSLAPGGTAWKNCINVETSGNYTYGGAFAGAASGSDVFVVGQRDNGIVVGFQLVSSVWAPIAGPESDGSIAHDSLVDPGTGMPHGAWAAGGPVFAWSDSASPDQINAAVLDASGASPVWSVIPQLNDVGAAAQFDIEGRGNVVLYAYVAESSGLLYLRELDLTNPASPVITALPGPAGATALNVNPACVAGHPELSNTDGAIWITWSETCTSGAWTVQLRELQ